MTSTVQPVTLRPNFVRDRFTWTAYLLLGYFAYSQSLLGPIMPFLRAELNLSYMIGSAHVSALAAGMVLVGLAGDRVLRRLGLRTSLWSGAIGLALGLSGLILGTHVAVTIGGALVMGVIGALLLVAQQTALAYRHGAVRAVAFTEGNIIASLGSMLAPMIVGAAVSGGIGWRVAPALALVFAAILLLREGRQPVPEPPQTADAHAAQQRLPTRFWAFWTVVCLGVAVEWSVGFWAAEYLHTVAGLPLEQAVTAMSAFFLAMLIGRTAGSRLTRRFAPLPLLIGSLALGLIGATVFWQAAHPVLALAALTITGLGVSNLFPLGLAVAVETAPDQAATASTRMTLAGGLAILTAPFALGSWADQIGLIGAFTVVPILLGLALTLALVMLRRQTQGDNR